MTDLRQIAVILATIVFAPSAEAEEYHESIQRMALAGIEMAYCSDQVYCAPATEAELHSPPVDPATMEQTISVAALSVLAENCGFDFERQVFAPYMQSLRADGGLAERQIAIVGVSHGIVMGLFDEEAQFQCSDEARQILAQNGIE
ncbi:MAG: hypothetical protein AAF401_11420 [Pseudomonadota bacterium]